ncbi:hypothetical protein GBAR_LOCUS28278, partial [Geodia barretti]
DISFQVNVKGLTQFGSALVVSGIVSVVADGTAVSSDFEQFLPIHITNQGVISISAVDDFITLEYDDRVRLTFTPSNPALVPGLEDFGEYIRDTSIVNINDTDNLQINFDVGVVIT